MLLKGHLKARVYCSIFVIAHMRKPVGHWVTSGDLMALVCKPYNIDAPLSCRTLSMTPEPNEAVARARPLLAASTSLKKTPTI